jgi:hypothetical protein
MDLANLKEDRNKNFKWKSEKDVDNIQTIKTEIEDKYEENVQNAKEITEKWRKFVMEK